MDYVLNENGEEMALVNYQKASDYIAETTKEALDEQDMHLIDMASGAVNAAFAFDLLTIVTYSGLMQTLMLAEEGNWGDARRQFEMIEGDL